MTTEQFIEHFETPTPENIVQGCELLCNDCGLWSKIDEWDTGGAYCESCGDDHFCANCPRCGETFDYIWANPINSRKTQ